MDALTAASSFSTIISLVGQFRSEKGGVKQADFNSFLTWLAETQHEELKALVETNVNTSIGIKALLNEQQDVLVAKLESLDTALASFASIFDGFSELGQGVKPTAKLSDQAVSILRQFEASEASKALEVHMMTEGIILIYIDGKGGQMEILDKRFVEDDLKSLVELKLLRHEYNSQGKNMYLFTRAASKLVRVI